MQSECAARLAACVGKTVLCGRSVILHRPRCAEQRGFEEDAVDVHEWLPKLCRLEMPHVRSFPWQATPLHVTCCGQDWTVATNGRVLVALAGHLPGYARDERGERAVASVLERETVWRETISLDLLQSWCGESKFDCLCDC